MNRLKQQLIIKSLLSLTILIILQFEEFKCLEERPSRDSEYKVLKIDSSIQIDQNSIAITYKLDLESKITQIKKYFIIDINLIGIQLKQSKLIVCLNYDDDILKDQRYIEQRQYNCTFTDNTPRIQQKQQYLLVIDTNDKKFYAQRTAYLTIFYEAAQQQITNIGQQLKNKVSFFLFMYYTNLRQCHKNCNGKNGVCNESTGKCICNKNYFDSDCNIETKELNFNKTNDIINILVQPQQYYIYKINMTLFVQSLNDNEISINFKKFSGDSSLDFQVLINKEQFPSIENHDLSLKLELQEIKLSNIKQICNNFKNNQQISNIPQQKSNNSINNNCFIFIQIYQSQSLFQITPIRISLQIEDNQIYINQNNHKNQNSTIIQIKQAKSETQQNHKTVIVITTVCSIAFIAIGVYLYLKYKQSKPFQPQTQTIVYNLNIDTVVQIIPQNKLNKEEQLEQRMKFIVQNRKYLQEKLMPIINLDQSHSKSISDINQIEKQNQFLLNQQTYDNYNDQLISEQNHKDNKIQMIQLFSQKCCPSKNFDCNNQILNENISYDLEKQNTKNIIQQSLKNNQNQQCCAICLIEFYDEERIRKTICNHIFHIGCFRDWLDKTQNCPLCRQSFEIMDMIDYQTQQLYKQKNDIIKKTEVINERNKIESKIEDLNNDIFQLSLEEFANIFSYFISSRQQKEILNNPFKYNEDDEKTNFSQTQSPVMSPLIQSTFCDQNSQNKLILDSSNNCCQNVNFQLNNYENLKNDEIIEPESNLYLSEICCSQENINNYQNQKSQSLISMEIKSNSN